MNLSRTEKIQVFEKLGRITKESDGKIISEENDEQIEVNWKSYVSLVKYSGGWNRLLLLNISLIAIVYCETLLAYKIGEWAHNEAL